MRVSGQVVPAGGSIKVVADRPGRISSRMVKEGANVASGQPMFELTSERSSRTGGVDARIGILLAQRHNELLQSRQLETEELAQRAEAFAIRQRAIEAEIASRQQEVALQGMQIKTARDKVASYKVLAKQGFVSPAQLGQVSGELNAQLARRSALESSVLAVKRDLLQVQEEARTINGKIKLVASRAGQSLAAVAQEAAEHDGRSSVRVLAPAAGSVTALTLDIGQAVSAGATLATIIPADSALEAHLLVPSRAVGFIASGQHVLLRLNAFAYQKFGQVAGTVARVERSPIGEAGVGPSAEPVYRVTVKLGQQSTSASQGCFAGRVATWRDLTCWNH